LLLTVDDLMRSFDQKIQSDIAILDFSRAFDTVPHERLLDKLGHYGIRGPIHNWIMAFLYNRQMWVVVDGKSSCKACVASGVPQGTVLGPLLFMLFINDLPNVVSPGTTTRLFADDCLVYREIKTGEDKVTLQRDLSALVTWAKIWGMQFNLAKCNVMRIHRLQSPFLRTYEFSGTTLAEVEQAKYLWITLSDKLDWEAQVDNITQKASNTLNFLKRNLKYCPKQYKEVAYFALVRSTVEYGSVVWDPHTIREKDKVERVNRRAARMVNNDYGRHSSVTSMHAHPTWLGYS